MPDQLERRADGAPARFGLDYAPAPEATDHVQLRADHGLLIGGRWVEPASQKRFKTINPATEEVLAEVAEAGEEDVDAAVRAARAAYTKVWSKLSGAERAKYLYRIARILQERAREVAGLETVDGSGRERAAASRSRSPATSTCPWPRPTSSTTPAGPTSWTTPSPAAARPPSGWAPRSSPGTSRCLWPPGSWPRPVPPATPGSSSRPRRPR